MCDTDLGFEHGYYDFVFNDGHVETIVVNCLSKYQLYKYKRQHTPNVKNIYFTPLGKLDTSNICIVKYISKSE